MLMTTAVQDAMTAHDTLQRGDISQARTKIDTAVNKLQSAVRKDATLGLTYSQGSGPVTATRFKTDLQRVQSNLRSGDRQAAQNELQRVLSQVGAV